MYKPFVTLAYKREPALPDVPVPTEPPMSAVARSERPAPPPADDAARDRRRRLAAAVAAVLLHAAVVVALLVTPPHPVPEPKPPIPVALVFEPPPPPPPPAPSPPEPVAKPAPKPPLRSNHSGDLDLPPGPAKEAGTPGTDPAAEQPPALSPKEASPAETTQSPPAAAAPPPTPDPPSAPSPAASPTPPTETPSPTPPAATPAAPTPQATASAAVPGPLLAPRPPAAERQAETPTPPMPQPKPAETKPPPSRPSPPAHTIDRPAPSAAQRGPVPTVAPARGSPDRSGGDPYFNEMLRQIRQHFVYPEAARALGLAGEARYVFVIDREGRLRSLRIEKSSGAEILDRAGYAAITRAAPLPAIPAGRPGDEMGLVLEFPMTPP
ncbi:MAG TPA: energy transducer TonB [Stellaceae bacterium]